MENFLDKKLNERIAQNALRGLTLSGSLIDFSSNDYLGFATSPYIKKKIYQSLSEHSNYKLGSTGSRLLSGNTSFAEVLENDIAQFHQAKAGLIFNSGYDANIGLFAAIAQKNDTIICDEFVHASIIDGIRLSLAKKFNFKHNNIESLESKLKNSTGNIFIAIESVYSMDGDIAPIAEIVRLADKYNANLIVDEAHAVGVLGKNGEGLVQFLDLHHTIFARIITFGKALACHGAIIVGSEKLKTFLINFARSFIYTTALPFHSLLTIKVMYEVLKNDASAYLKLQQNIQLFNKLMLENYSGYKANPAAIQQIMMSGNAQCKAASDTLKLKNFDVRAILSPTVPINKERLRICLHSFNSKTEIENLCLALSMIHE